MKLEDHEIIDRYIGDLAAYEPSDERGEVSMEPDIDGEWINKEQVEKAILDSHRLTIGERLYAYYTEEEIELWLIRPHPLLDGATALQMLAQGHDDRIHLAIDALEEAIDMGQVAT